VEGGIRDPDDQDTSYGENPTSLEDAAERVRDVIKDVHERNGVHASIPKGKIS